MDHLLAPVLFGLAASLCWGSGDFSGGLASRRANTSSVVLAAYAVGFILMVILALIWREPFPDAMDLLWGGLAGVAGVLGLLAFYSALSSGKMGIAAPVSAVLTAMLPVLFDVAAILSSLYPAATVLPAALVVRERATRLQSVGILLVLLAVPLISV